MVLEQILGIGNVDFTQVAYIVLAILVTLVALALTVSPIASRVPFIEYFLLLLYGLAVFFWLMVFLGGVIEWLLGNLEWVIIGFSVVIAVMILLFSGEEGKKRAKKTGKTIKVVVGKQKK